MEALGDTRFMYLPGTDSLKSAEYFNSRDNIGRKAVSAYRGEESHWRYLDNPTYDKYLRIPKLIVDSDGAQELISIGDELAGEAMPRFLDAAGWAYAEAGLALDKDSTVHRMQLIKKAEQAWHRALVNDLDIGRRYKEQRISDEESGHRLALNLAYTPLMKSIIVGNVTDSVRETVFKDTLAIAMNAAEIMEDAYKNGNHEVSRQYWGFLFEANALMTILHMNDPRLVPLPSSARADSGYYNASQTHDISIIHQNWGDIRRVIPVEIKSSSSLRDRKRYKALIIRGKMHLTINNHNPATTVHAFQGMIDGNASKSELDAIERNTLRIRDMLHLYQQGITPRGLATSGLTRFYDTNKLVEVYPELSKLPRKNHGQ
jgi:hypothetical protein